ncbi:hypothetical protein M3210_02825 [Oceanobacillus luteolus]|uniref:hypothetical protein n=1 Tax=Oceanobacillus luteolus TaxID=1274358 RepID=UPI002041418F|nr:hypothetical protein [Oceanobacillus luteolus]MCM3739196.1 hypothetical protein [Oceanobacillus luteolus]
MGLEHPAITQIERTGYPYSAKREDWGTDGLGNEILSGDEILEFMEEVYVVEELSSDAREILEQHGAIYKIAK